MENSNTTSKKMHVNLITDNFFILNGLSHKPDLNIEIIPCSIFSFVNRYLPGDGIKIIDMDSWERFFMTSHPSLRETIHIYHSDSVIFLAKNIRQEMVTELLYPEIKSISLRNCAIEIQLHLMGKASKPFRQLTPRQRQIMLLMISGVGYKATCSALEISAKTVNTHLRSVLSKVSLRKFSHFFASIIPYAQDITAARSKENFQLKNLSEDTSYRKEASAYRDVMRTN